jgi:hypothetical protein
LRSTALCASIQPADEVLGTHRKNRVAHALRLAAWSLMRSWSALGAYLRRQRSRLGVPKAITATAHKLARIVYHLVCVTGRRM